MVRPDGWPPLAVEPGTPGGARGADETPPSPRFSRPPPYTITVMWAATVHILRSAGLAAAIALAGVAPAQDAAPLPPGSADLLREKLEEYVKAAHGTGAGEKDPRRAVEVERSLARYEWKDVD